MDNQFFLDAGIPFDHPAMPTWHSLTPMDIPTSDLHFPAPATQSSDRFFDSALSSMASSPVSASNSSDSFVLRKLVGKLGNICNSGEIPPKMSIGSINRAIMENLNTHLGNSIPVPAIGTNLPAMPGDPRFVERAARFSSFGSRSVNGRKTQIPSPNPGFASGAKLQRVSSSPIINGPENKNPGCSNRIGNEPGSRPGNDLNSGSRKRKSLPKGKCRDIPCSSPAKVVENGDESNAKRSKLNEETNDGKTEQKSEEEEEDEESKKQRNSEAPKDYIHVRARRGQATDSHSLAERVRREKISERMKLLQDLVPGCDKVTGKALMLEEIINYVQSLQRQVEFLSMKLANVNPSLDFDTDTHFQKDVFEPNCSMQTYTMDNLAPAVYGGHQHPQNPLQQNGTTGSGLGPQCPNSMDPINQSHDMQLANINGFNNGVPELCEGDLHTIVQMGFAHNTTHQSLQGSNQAPATKIEF